MSLRAPYGGNPTLLKKKILLAMCFFFSLIYQYISFCINQNNFLYFILEYYETSRFSAIALEMQAWKRFSNLKKSLNQKIEIVF